MAQLQLQRSTVSFRRQGSSGLVWDDRFVSGEKKNPKDSFLSGELRKPSKLQQEGSCSPPFIRSFSLNKDFRHTHTAKSSNLKTNMHTSAPSDGPDVFEPPTPRRKGWVCCGGFSKGSKSNGVIQPIKSRPK
ncbi:hypothetical protein vseg_013004 [Gypsophila vaccaria]